MKQFRKAEQQLKDYLHVRKVSFFQVILFMIA